MPEISETLKGSFTKFFGTVRQKIFDGNLWYPQLSIKIFDTPNFLRHWRDAHKIFRHCETKNFRRKNVIPPSMHKIFRYPKFSETLKGCPRIFLVKTMNFLKHFGRNYETKNFRRKNVIPPFSSIKLFKIKNFLRNSRISLRKFSALWDIKISTENCDMRPFIHKFFSIPKKQKSSFTKLFVSVLWDKKFRQNRHAPPPPLICMKIFDKRIFLNHQSVLQWNFSVQWDKIFRRKILILPPLSYPNFFATGNFLKHSTEGFTYQIFRHCETKKSTENHDITLWSIKFFDTRN